MKKRRFVFVQSFVMWDILKHINVKQDTGRHWKTQLSKITLVGACEAGDRMCTYWQSHYWLIGYFGWAEQHTVHCKVGKSFFLCCRCRNKWWTSLKYVSIILTQYALIEHHCTEKIMVSQWEQMVKSSGLGLQALRLVGASGTPAHLNLEQFAQCIFFTMLTKMFVCT